MCSECKKILEQKFKGAILASAKEYFDDIRVQINFMDFVSFRLKEFENHDKIESKYWNELP